MPVLLDNNPDNVDNYTLFGFTTKNGFAAKALNVVYIVVMVVAIAFAFHALNLILPDWNTGIIFLAAIAVVGLPYCIKIIMYGKHEFEYRYAVLCILISLLPTIFDFVGFYSETSIRSALQKTKFEVLETVNYFDKDARSSITKKILLLENEHNANLANVEKNFNSLTSDIKKEINTAEQTLIDETKGVRGGITSGKAGMGPRALELEADVRKIKADTEIKLGELEKNKNQEISKLIKEYETKLTTLQQGIQAIDNLMVSNENGEGLIFEVNKSKSFNDLADVSVKLNNAVNVISSKLNVEPKYIKFESDNVINLSFSALLRGDITALVCFLLALLLEVVDTIIVYMVRGVKKTKRKIEEPVNNIRETIHYNF
jgi:hypothetical protein